MVKKDILEEVLSVVGVSKFKGIPFGGYGKGYFYYRLPHIELLTASKRSEFFHILTVLTWENGFIRDDWDYYAYHFYTEYDYSDEVFEKHVRCCCNHCPLHHIWYLIHLPTNKIFRVGSVCMKNISLEMHDYMISYQDKLKKPRCKNCPEFLEDRRKTIQKEGFCSDECKESFGVLDLVCDFGKHKGKMYGDIELSWIEWFVSDEFKGRKYDIIRTSLRKKMNL